MHIYPLADSASLTGGTAIDLTSSGTNTRYVTKLTVTTNPNNSTISCVQTDPATGAKRSVTVLTNSGWVQ
jgi:hypothetical protein